MRNPEMFTTLLLSFCLFTLLNSSEADEADILQRLRTSKSGIQAQSWEELHATRDYSPVYIGPRGSMELDKINALPGQPENDINFDQYAGYVTVDPQAGKALFYYFAESPENSSTNPLVLWLNGGPGCSSFGHGAMKELGPFRVNSDGKTLSQNNYAWNSVANVLFLESPAGVGFSYSNTSANYPSTGDKGTADDAYTFLVNWLERFPQYKTRDFFITGESYAGHYVPQLADTILFNNNHTNGTVINLKGIAIGNGVLNDPTDALGYFDYFWTHALISDETVEGIHTNCDFTSGIGNLSSQCFNILSHVQSEIGNVYDYNIYAPLCHKAYTGQDNESAVAGFDPCSELYVTSYLNKAEVQSALHAKPTRWNGCNPFVWTDRASTVLPIIKNLMASDIRVWIYSGDVDSVVPVTSTRYSISTLNLPIKNPWHPWYTNNEVGGYVVAYEGLTFLTVRGAGHQVPSYQPERALTMISSFLEGRLPPSAS